MECCQSSKVGLVDFVEDKHLDLEKQTRTFHYLLRRHCQDAIVLLGPFKPRDPTKGGNVIYHPHLNFQQIYLLPCPSYNLNKTSVLANSRRQTQSSHTASTTYEKTPGVKPNMLRVEDLTWFPQSFAQIP